MHCQKWDRGKHLRLCKAKAAWPETFAASDAVLHNKKDSSANKCCTELSTRYCYCKISLSVLTSSSMWKLLCLCQHLTALLLLNLVQPSLSSGHRRHQAIEGWWWNTGFRGPKERASLCGSRYNIHCICHDWEGTKDSDVKQRPWCHNTHTYYSNVMAEGSPGPSLHHCQCHYSGPPPSTAGWDWYHGTECQCRWGPGSSVQRVGGGIMKERGNLNIFTTTTTTIASPTQN